MSNKRIVFLLLGLLGFQFYDLQASNNAQAVYWDTLEESHKNIVRQYSGFLTNCISEVNIIPSQIFFALYDPEHHKKIKEQEDGTILGMINTLYKPLNEVFSKTDLSRQAQSHISKIFLDMHKMLVGLLTPVQAHYDQIRKKEMIILDDATNFQDKVTNASTQISNKFLTENRAMRQNLFPSYLGEKAPLNPKITTLLEEIEKDMDERKGFDHDETVMVHGGILAQKFFNQIISFIPKLINIDMAAAQLPSYVGLKEWIETFEDLDLKNSLIKQMDEKLNSNRTNVEEALHNSVLSADYNISSLNSGYVWKSTAHIIRTIYDQYGRTEPDAKALLLTYFIKLNEQNGTCTAGGIGRNFQVLTQAYKFLIQLNSRSIN